MYKVLVVDDDLEILMLVKITLTIHNYIVEGVDDWQDIDLSIASFKPDVILMDVALGTADGRDVCKKLKDSPETQHIPVVLFSANKTIENNVQGYNAQAFIGKPYNLKDMLLVIKDVIGESKAIPASTG